ncbi:MAG TPA: nucleotidyltransferase domain-containing protein [Actinomycetota bacterium]
MADALAERRSERERLIGMARAFVDDLAERIPIVAAAVVGSVARGDFNVWSDVDLVVVCEQLPQRAPDRGALLAERAPAGFQIIGFTPEEFRVALARENRLAREAVDKGIALAGAEFFGSA